MKLSAFIIQEGLTVSAFAALVGVPNKQTMSRYVRCERFPPPEVLHRIREITGGQVTADDFVDQHLANAVEASVPTETAA